MLETNIVPQLFELYTGMVGLDLKIKVVDLSAINGTCLGKIGSYHKYCKTINTSQGRKTQGLISGFNLSVSFVTPSLIQHIWETYHMDVLLLHHTGVTSTMCNKQKTIGLRPVIVLED